MPTYRPNVAAIILNSEGEILVCERKNDRGAWQFPQGGVDGKESILEALEREVLEEVGIPRKDYKIIEYREDYKYLYPERIRKSKKWDGQVQTYFLCKLKKKAKGPNLGKNNAEFRAFAWVMPEDFDVEWLPWFKLEVYRDVMYDFFGVEL